MTLLARASGRSSAGIGRILLQAQSRGDGMIWLRSAKDEKNFFPRGKAMETAAITRDQEEVIMKTLERRRLV